ncbi:MAG: DUF4366 domain-containing protein [Oscillospiraceae bacterium]|nr:DUF4366 domain-containing protein [Oscillospiraceae bacterium]MBQ9412543.1 DUF4366 domain-containing protein [Oscillospiraceae bacterium]
MRHGKFRALLALLTVLLCAAAMSLTAFAYGGDSKRDQPLFAFPVEDDDEDTNLALRNLLSSLTEAFTPDGNLSLIDDFRYSGLDEDGNSIGKQFLTVQSKSGNYFFLIVDRAADRENVYFLNLVDEADLLALMDSPATEPPAVCTCRERCYVGHVDTTCPVCAVNLRECLGKEAKPEPTASPEGAEPEPQPTKGAIHPTLALVLLLALGGGAVYFFRKWIASGKPKTKGDTDLSEYEFGEEDAEYEFEPDETEGQTAEGEDERV